jgi:hypothetical protein
MQTGKIAYMYCSSSRTWSVCFKCLILTSGFGVLRVGVGREGDRDWDKTSLNVGVEFLFWSENSHGNTVRILDKVMKVA